MQLLGAAQLSDARRFTAARVLTELLVLLLNEEARGALKPAGQESSLDPLLREVRRARRESGFSRRVSVVFRIPKASNRSFRAFEVV